MIKGYILVLMVSFQATYNSSSASITYTQCSKERTYTFAFSNDGFPANYEENGILKGQSVDMVLEVCRRANKSCKVALVQRPQCYTSNRGFPAFSEALNGHWFDGCANLPASPSRWLAYQFPQVHYFNTAQPSLIGRKNSTITLERLKTCNQYKLAFAANTAVEPKCLLNSGYFIKKENIFPVVSEGDLVDTNNKIIRCILNKEFDLGIVITRFLQKDPDIKILGAIQCKTDIVLGLNIMVRKDEDEFLQWWDQTLLEFICSGEPYKQFCNKLEALYGVDPYCRKPGVDIDCSAHGGPSLAPSTTLAPLHVNINPCGDIIFKVQHLMKWTYLTILESQLTSLTNTSPQNGNTLFQGFFGLDYEDNMIDLLNIQYRLCVTRTSITGI